MSLFELVARCGSARAGILHTRHGPVTTPHFMPVATQATVKSLSVEEVAETGTRMLIMNTYHLWLRPGPDVIEEHGGLHAFGRWPYAIATDSGGYQAFSLAERTKISEEGFEFSSHLDGLRLLLSPETAMSIQGKLNSDIALQLDVCPPATASRPELEAAVARTTRWAERCVKAKRPGQALLGILQGGSVPDLRLEHARQLARLPIDGLALGGFGVGEPNQVMHDALAEIVPRLEPGQLHYLMGIGTPADLIRAISVGVDLFDCVLPTRNARNGQAFTRGGKVVIKNSRYRYDLNPLEPGCDCPACRGGYTRSYLRHLYTAKELLSYRLVTLHNVFFFTRLMREARAAIIKGTFDEWASAQLAALD